MTEVLAIPKFCKDCDFRGWGPSDPRSRLDSDAWLCEAPENTIIDYNLITGEPTRKFKSCEEARTNSEILDYKSCGISAHWFKDKITEASKRAEDRTVASIKPKGTFTIGTDI